MPDTIDRKILTDEVIASFDVCPDPRLRHIMQKLAYHLHAFARDARLTEQEWLTGIEFLTKTGQFSTQTRPEFILLSDVLGLSMLVVEMNQRKGTQATEPTVLGPFYVPGVPELPRGAMVVGNPIGDPCEVTGRVLTSDGTPVANAMLDVWQADGDGLYSNQDPNKGEFGLRGKFRTAEDGTYLFRTVMPRGYQIPPDGPVADMMRTVRRAPWRPAHLHFIVSAPGCWPVTTHLFVKGDEHINEDAVFGVKEPLIADFKKKPDGSGYRLDYDFILEPAAG